jgi:hypothetical protein
LTRAAARVFADGRRAASVYSYCYLPLYVFCGQDILACVLRPSWRDPASVFSALIKLIARRLRQAWPGVRLVARGDSGFCRAKALRRFGAWGIDYIVGLQKNSVLLERVAIAQHALQAQYEAAGATLDVTEVHHGAAFSASDVHEHVKVVAVVTLQVGAGHPSS